MGPAGEFPWIAGFGSLFMKIVETELPGVVVIEPRIFGDERGFLFETWSRERYAEAGLPASFVQDNVSFSRPGVLRGLHYQHPSGQGKLVTALQGEIFDIAVDIRQGSPTFGRWVGVMLSGESMRQIYIPPGFAHGFAVLGEPALVTYKCTDFYNPQHESSIRWDDPDLAIKWPAADPIVNAKDRAAPLLRDVPADRLPRFGP
jgi:dTDP-4-dehydrorhamnose 3,5-epimerase